MTSVKSKEFCKYPYTCYNKECGFSHPVPFETRSHTAHLLKKGKYEEEKKADGRKQWCRHGVHCYNFECGYRHQLSAEGRNEFQKDLKEKAEKPKKDSKKEKKVEVDAPKSFNYEMARNAYRDLGDRYGISAEDPSYVLLRDFIESLQQV